jgi:serine/threonine protein kinase
MKVTAGMRLGPYEIVAPIGAGGMGAVYRARDTRLGRDVAIKVLPPHLMDSPDALARFEREAQAVAALNHPNILALHDVGRDGSITYAVTELLEGETLRSALSHHPMSARRALDALVQIARGLGAAHDRGIVHRDIKPENLFLTRDGHVKILDFGVATQTDTAVATNAPTMQGTGPGMLVGTLAYMAPEQLAGEHATARSDLFAFGIVAYELLTGAHPFARQSVTETMGAILRDPPPPLGRAANEFGPAVPRMLARCLEKSPADRLSSARDLATYLDVLGSTQDVVAAAPATEKPTAGGRVPRRVFFAALAAVSLITSLIWGTALLTTGGTNSESAAADLARVERLVQRVQAERLSHLALTARLIGSFPEVKALFGTDSATMRDFLMSQQAIVPGAPTLIALLPDRRLLARTDSAPDVSPPSDNTWIETLLTNNEGTGVVLLDGRLYHAARASSDAGGSTFGHIVAALQIDQEFARAVSDATHDDIVLLGEGVTASTLRGAQTPWRSLKDWRDAGGQRARAIEIEIENRPFSAREIVLSEQPALSAVAIAPR